MSKDNLKGILDSLVETGVYVIRRDTHELLYFNKRVSQISPEAKLGMKCHEVWKGSCQDCPLEVIEGKDSSHTIHYNDPFGEVVDIMATKSQWDDIPAFVIIVTPHKLNYEEQKGLEKIEKVYSKSLVTVFNECIIANLTQDFYVNCQMDMLWSKIPKRGYFEENNYLYAKTLIHPEDREAFLAFFSSEAMLKIFKDGKKQISKRMRRLMEDGSYHMAEFTSTFLENFGEENIWCVLVYRDIHEDYLQEQKIYEDIFQLATAARVAYQMLIAANLTQNTYYMLEYERFATKKAAETGIFDDLIMVGASTVDPDFREEFIRRFSRDALLEAFSRGELQVNMEMRQLGDDGQYHWNFTQVIRIFSPYTDDVLQVTMSKCIDDVRKQQEEQLAKERTAKLLLEEALEKSKVASQAKSDFLSRMSHDLRTPMNAIMGMTVLAQSNASDPEKLQGYLRKIQVSSQHLMGLLNEVLDVSRIESGHMELAESELNLADLIQESILMVQPAIQKKNQFLTVEIDAMMHSMVQADGQRLRQLLVNILENANKYSDENGKIRISVNELNKEEKEIGIYEFVIEDNGIGMNETFISRIFEPFSRADDTRINKIPGTGLGMTIVKSIVTMMGGQIKIESDYGHGSRFVITLYLKKINTAQEREPEAEAGSGSDYSGLRVLVADDNEMNQEITQEMLAILGARADVVENGLKAVEAVVSHPVFYYDIIFMDVQMPMMDGYEAVRQIRGLKEPYTDQLLIFALTADAFPEDEKRSTAAGMNGHLTKPVNMEQLKKVLEYSRMMKEENRGE